MNSQSGNVLWFILVAVVLLGALTVVLTRSGSSVDQSADVEQMRVKASQIIRYAKSIDSAIEQMLLRNVSENELSFSNGDTATDYTNAFCDDDADNTYPGCLMFNKNGGGLEYRAFSEADWVFTGSNAVGSEAAPVGGEDNDLVMMIPVSEILCVQINREANVENTDGKPPVEDSATLTAFTGTYTGSGVIDGDSSLLELDGHAVGCFSDGADPAVNYFYAVILAR